MRKVMLGVLLLAFSGAFTAAWLSSTTEAPVGSKVGDITLADERGIGTSGRQSLRPETTATPQREFSTSAASGCAEDPDPATI